MPPRPRSLRRGRARRRRALRRADLRRGLGLPFRAPLFETLLSFARGQAPRQVFQLIACHGRAPPPGLLSKLLQLFRQRLRSSASGWTRLPMALTNAGPLRDHRSCRTPEVFEGRHPYDPEGLAQLRSASASAARLQMLFLLLERVRHAWCAFVRARAPPLRARAWRSRALALCLVGETLHLAIEFGQIAVPQGARCLAQPGCWARAPMAASSPGVLLVAELRAKLGDGVRSLACAKAPRVPMPCTDVAAQLLGFVGQRAQAALVFRAPPFCCVAPHAFRPSRRGPARDRRTAQHPPW